MEPYKLGEMEQRFADLLWQLAPLTTRELAERCAGAFGWKRTTTYTMLKRLCQRGLFANEGGTVRPLMSREEFGAAQGEVFLDSAFGGSLPQFFAAFTRRKKLSEGEIEELRQLIENYGEGPSC